MLFHSRSPGSGPGLREPKQQRAKPTKTTDNRAIMLTPELPESIIFTGNYISHMRKTLLGVLAAMIVFTSCSEDIDLSAPYKDLTVTYGLLDADNDTNWIRIQKAYLGDDDALLYAVIPDSLYYPATLDAWILAFNASNVQVDSIHLERLVNVFVKDPGTFATDSNVLYRAVGLINVNYTYQLFIKKPNGDTTSAETIICNDIVMAYPPTAATPLDWEPDNILDPTQSVNFRWVHDANSYAYQLGLRFHYEEWEVGTPGNVTDTSFTYYFPLFRPTADFSCFGNQVCHDVSKEQFYDLVVQNIEEDPSGTPGPNIHQRRFISLDVIVLQASEELYNYITINAPSLSYVQKVTAYTNVVNGHGIFGSRTTGGINGLQLNTQTKDSLMGGQYTYQLNFVP